METAAFPGAIGVDRHLAGQPQGLLQPGVTMTHFTERKTQEVPRGGRAHPLEPGRARRAPDPDPPGRLAQYLCSAWP